uniref:Uncharacterized protein n=1 Tax=Spermophilus dauricus TaxID=99837 RepID=A0A8C9US80_SPEDA
VAEGSMPCVNDQPPASPLSILFALLCPRMSFDLSLPFLGPPAFPAFLHPFLLLPMIFLGHIRPHLPPFPGAMSAVCSRSYTHSVTGSGVCRAQGVAGWRMSVCCWVT